MGFIISVSNRPGRVLTPFVTFFQCYLYPGLFNSLLVVAVLTVSELVKVVTAHQSSPGSHKPALLCGQAANQAPVLRKLSLPAPRFPGFLSPAPERALFVMAWHTCEVIVYDEDSCSFYSHRPISQHHFLAPPLCPPSHSFS